RGEAPLERRNEGPERADPPRADRGDDVLELFVTENRRVDGDALYLHVSSLALSPFQRKPFLLTKQMLPPSRDRAFFSNSLVASVPSPSAGVISMSSL